MKGQQYHAPNRWRQCVQTYWDRPRKSQPPYSSIYFVMSWATNADEKGDASVLVGTIPGVIRKPERG